jgi:hypothetical protein
MYMYIYTYDNRSTGTALNLARSATPPSSGRSPFKPVKKPNPAARRRLFVPFLIGQIEKKKKKRDSTSITAAP